MFDNFFHMLRTAAGTLLFAGFAMIVPIPDCLQILVNLLYAGVVIALAGAWARVLADEGFWFWTCFILCLIPATKIETMAVLAIYSFGRAVWQTLKPIFRRDV